MFGMLWINVYDSVYNIQLLRTAIEEKWDNIAQATINSPINCEGDVTMHETNGGHTRC
jgi:putative heme degradation protein